MMIDRTLAEVYSGMVPPTSSCGYHPPPRFDQLALYLPRHDHPAAYQASPHSLCPYAEPEACQGRRAGRRYPGPDRVCARAEAARRLEAVPATDGAGRVIGLVVN
jgi:hypothetical protein